MNLEAYRVNLIRCRAYEGALDQLQRASHVMKHIAAYRVAVAATDVALAQYNAAVRMARGQKASEKGMVLS